MRLEKLRFYVARCSSQLTLGKLAQICDTFWLVVQCGRLLFFDP